MKAAFISCCTLSLICELSYLVHYHFEVPEYSDGVYLRRHCKEYIVCVCVCVLPRVPPMPRCKNSRSIMHDRPIYSTSPFFFFHLSFTVVLSLPTRSETTARMFHEPATVTFSLTLQSQYWWGWTDVSTNLTPLVGGGGSFPENSEMTACLSYRASFLLLVVCCRLSGVIDLWYIMNVLNHETLQHTFWSHREKLLDRYKGLVDKGLTAVIADRFKVITPKFEFLHTLAWYFGEKWEILNFIT
jgi:hypothetical protein